MLDVERPSRSVPALADKELEILRLLANGHTVKSIAARLGRSEASINERLREARRKTGMGSSRELARLLDAQKIWDKNFDLPGPGSPTEDTAQRPQPGRERSKGTRIMLVAIPLAAAGIAMLASGPMQQSTRPPAAQAAASRPSPLVGRWSLDTTRIPANERPQRVTLEFRVSKAQLWTGIVDIVGPDGTHQHAESTGALDGTPLPLVGTMQFADAVALRQPAKDTLVMTFTKNGTPVSTRVYTVESNRNAMKETIVWAGSEEPRMVTTFFKRVG